jgi:hypothetical protein
MKFTAALLATATVAGIAGTTLARPLGTGDINGVFEVPYLFVDRPDSVLTITNNFPSSYEIDENNFGDGGFANRHTAYFSTDGGASPLDFGYDDGFDLCINISVATLDVTSEVGFHADGFGLGVFALLGNGEIASFGTLLPFHSFGLVTAPNYQGDLSLRMIHRVGDGNGVDPLAPGANPSTIEYLYDIGGGWISSGLVPITTGEGGIPTGANMLIGFGTQNNGADPITGASNVLFTDVKAIPTPGALALAGCVGLIGLRRRR